MHMRRSSDDGKSHYLICIYQWGDNDGSPCCIRFKSIEVTAIHNMAISLLYQISLCHSPTVFSVHDDGFLFLHISIMSLFESVENDVLDLQIEYPQRRWDYRQSFFC